ncbi:MAG: hypothetical protein IPN72_25135 [Saprospiraceae bacterium]|nr:hypothetical protein [Saprospiraceae bacterium]
MDKAKTMMHKPKTSDAVNQIFTFGIGAAACSGGDRQWLKNCLDSQDIPTILQGLHAKCPCKNRK